MLWHTEVLAEARACGWLAYRPQQGKLIRSDSQGWAKQYTEGSQHLAVQTRAARYSGLAANGVPVLPVAPASMPLPAPGSLPETTGFNAGKPGQSAETAVIAFQELAGEALGASIVQLNQTDPARQAQLDKVTSQKLGRSAQKELAGPSSFIRAEQAEEWQEALGTMTIQRRLKQLIPSAAKGKCQPVSKLVSKIQKAQRQAAKRKRLRQEAAALTDTPANTGIPASEADVPANDGEDVPALPDMPPPKPGVPPMPVHADFSAATLADKQKAWSAAGAELQLDKFCPGSLIETAELYACHLVQFRE